MVGGIDPGVIAVEPRLGMGQFAIDHPLRASGRAKGHGVDTGCCGSRQIAEIPCGGEETTLAWIDLGATHPPIIGVSRNRCTIRLVATRDTGRPDSLAKFANPTACNFQPPPN